MLRFLTFTAMVAASYTAIFAAFNHNSPTLDNPTVAASLAVIGLGFILELKRKITASKITPAKVKA